MARLPNTFPVTGGPVSGEGESILGGRRIKQLKTYKQATPGQEASTAAGTRRGAVRAALKKAGRKRG